MIAFTVISGIVWLVVVVSLAVTGVIMVRRRVSEETLKKNEGSVSATLGAVGTLFTVLLAFTIVIVWNHFTTANEAVEAEATHIGDLSRLARSFPDAEAQRIKKNLINYVSVVVADEWPAMAAGHDDARAWDAMTDLWEAYLDLKPSDAAHQAAYSESLADLTVLADARRVAALIALNLFLIYALDKPFRGWPRIGPDSMKEELQRIEAHR